MRDLVWLPPLKVASSNKGTKVYGFFIRRVFSRQIFDVKGFFYVWLVLVGDGEYNSNYHRHYEIIMEELKKRKCADGKEICKFELVSKRGIL